LNQLVIEVRKSLDHDLILWDGDVRVVPAACLTVAVVVAVEVVVVDTNMDMDTGMAMVMVMVMVVVVTVTAVALPVTVTVPATVAVIVTVEDTPDDAHTTIIKLVAHTTKIPTLEAKVTTLGLTVVNDGTLPHHTTRVETPNARSLVPIHIQNLILDLVPTSVKNMKMELKNPMAVMIRNQMISNRFQKRSMMFTISTRILIQIHFMMMPPVPIVGHCLLRER